MKIDPDISIIEGIRQGGVVRERSEFALYQKYAQFVAKRPRKYGLSDEQARDAYTDAFLVVIDHILSERFRGESTLKTYLSRIFRNKCVDIFRKNTTSKVNWVDEFPDLPDPSRDFLRKLMGKERLEQLGAFMERLSERCREILLYSGQGYGPAEIAEKMGFSSAKSSSSQRYKCLEKLKQLMKDHQQSGSF